MKSVFFAIFIQTVCIANSYKILLVFNLPIRSHHILGYALARGLGEAGHDVTMVSAFEEKIPTTTKGKFTNVVLTGFTQHKSEHGSYLFKLGELSPFFSAPLMVENGNAITNKTLEHDNFQKLINSNEKFDAVIIEQFSNDALKALAHHYQAPLIMFSTVDANNWVNSLVGNPSPPSYIPDTFTSYSSKMTFWQRTVNSFLSLFHQLYRHFVFYPKQNEIMKRHFPNSPDWDNTIYNISLFLLNSHESVNHAVPLLPNMINIGGFHISPPEKLPNDLQEFMDNAEEGVVYFSMGSRLKPSKIDPQTKQAILNALAKLKQKVLWKWDEDDFPGKPSNVRIGKWLPQQDILAHPNVKLFITHGGLLSTLETVYHGIPILALPILGDQKMNAAKAVEAGYAISLTISDLTEESFTNALHELLNNPKYRENAKRRSAFMHDRPVKPLDLAVYWIEFVIRHRGAPHLRVAALGLTWYQYFLLDVISVVLLIIISFLLVLSMIVKILCCSRKGVKKLKKN